MDLPTDQYELYAQFGITAEKAQCLEVDAGNAALAYVALFIPTEEIDADICEWFRQLVEDVNRRTLGNLLKHVKDMGTLDQNILTAIDAALEKRNYLMHRFFPAHNFAIFSEKGRVVMIEELRAIQAQLDRARLVLQGMAGTLHAVAGRESLSQELLEKLVSDGKSVGI